MGPDFDKICFVIMPFGKEGTPEREQFDDTYENIIKKAVEESGLELKCVRVDEITRSGSIIDDIIRYAIKSKFVIADLSGRNPNVFYELGIRHSFSGKTVLLAQSSSDLPFDVRPLRTIMYSKETLRKAQEAKGRLTNFLRDMNSQASQDDSPVLSVVANAKKLDTPERYGYAVEKPVDVDRFSQRVANIVAVMDILPSRPFSNHAFFAVFEREVFMSGSPLRQNMLEMYFFWKDSQFDPNDSSIYAEFVSAIKGLVRANLQILDRVSSSKFIFPYCGKMDNERGFLQNIQTHYIKNRKPASQSILQPPGMQWLGAVRFEVWDIDKIERLEKNHCLILP